jgi:hypothetical protein
MTNIKRTEINGTIITTSKINGCYLTQIIGGTRDGENATNLTESGARSTHDRYIAAAR